MSQFMKLDKNPTCSYESKIQHILRKIKSKLSTEKEKKLDPIGSNGGRFYETAKVHKIDRNDKVDQLLLRLIVFNVGTASYQLAKYVALVTIKQKGIHCAKFYRVYGTYKNKNSSL